MIPQLQQEAPVSAPTGVPQWSPITRIGFRFVFSYFFLYIAPGPVGSLSTYKSFNGLDKIWSVLWHQVVPWVGTNILHLNANALSEVANGSGDELYDYVLILCLLVTAGLITAIWSWLDRKRTNYQTLYGWLRLLMRMVVAWAMLGYGVKKLLGAQFPGPSLGRLVEPFGQASPMGLMWTFMAASPLYGFFGGLGETVGGILIVLPGLTALGSLICLAMSTNVLLLNLGYDVPRKIFTIHLILMCVFLLIPEFRRLANVFVFNRRADPVPEVALFNDKLMSRAAIVLPIVFAAFVLWIAGRQSYEDAKGFAVVLPPSIRGVWLVNGFVVDGTPHPPLLTDSGRWKNVIFDTPSVLTVQSMDGKQNDYPMRIDHGKTVRLLNAHNPQWQATLEMDSVQPDQIVLEGQFGNEHVSATLDRSDLTDPEKFPLVNRGLHWVNPDVYNH